MAGGLCRPLTFASPVFSDAASPPSSKVAGTLRVPSRTHTAPLSSRRESSITFSTVVPTSSSAASRQKVHSNPLSHSQHNRIPPQHFFNHPSTSFAISQPHQPSPRIPRSDIRHPDQKPAQIVDFYFSSLYFSCIGKDRATKMNSKPLFPKNSDTPTEVFGAWGTSDGLSPELIERREYLEYIKLLEDVNNVSPQAPGIIAAAVVFRSRKKSTFILGNSTGELIITGTIKDGKSVFDDGACIFDRGKKWLVSTANDGSRIRIRVYRDPVMVRPHGLLFRLLDALSPQEYEGVVQDSLVIPILTEFFSMRVHVPDSITKP
jgi:hypothetical protein